MSRSVPHLVFSILLNILLWCFFCASPAIAQTGVNCSNDLMKSYGIRIPHAKLIKNKEPTGLSQIFCKSTYKIPGKYAHVAEALLVKKHGMGKLVFACCGWSPENGQEGTFRRSHPTARRGEYAVYSITMNSEETVEKQWEKIGNFYIELTIYAN